MNDSNFDLMTDQAIIAQLGQQFDLLRRSKSIQDKTVIEDGGVHGSSLNNFRQGTGNPTLTTLIKILRGLGELERLEKLFAIPQHYSPTGKESQIPAKRVRTKVVKPHNIQWKRK